MPPLNLLIGYAKFVSMSLFLVWQDRALSVYIKAVGASKQKHCLLLLVKLRMTELNARKNMALGSTFRCMCNYGICFEVYVSMTVFVACIDSGYLAVCITWRKLRFCLEDSGVNKWEVEASAPGAAFWGRKLGLECHVTITKCQMSADASNYDLQNVECKSLITSCKISSRSPRFAKRPITNLSDISRRRLCLQQPAPACALTDGCVTMLSGSQACELSHFDLIL